MRVNEWAMQQRQIQQNWARLQEFRAREEVVRERERQAQVHDQMAEALDDQGKPAAAEQARGVARLIRKDPDYFHMWPSE